MSDSRVFMFPDNFGGNSGNGSSIDPNLLLALNNGGGFGGNGNWMWILFLFFLWPFMRNGNGFFGGNGNGFTTDGTGYLANLANNDTARELFMQGINGNRAAIDQLSSMLGCKLGDIQNSINSVMTQIQSVGNQVGMGIQQTINAVQAGNTQLGMQIAQCCCDLRAQMSSCCCDIEKGIAANAAANTRGFADVGYALRDQTCSIEKSIEASTSRILEGQRAAEMREMQNKIDALRDANLQKDNAIAEARQTHIVGQMISQATTPIVQAVGALQSDVNGIKCKLPETVTLPYSCATAVPTNVVYGANGFGLGWGLNGGCCGNSLWG